MEQNDGVITVTRDVEAPARAVWDVLADGWSYATWVVGASRVREVEDAWPAEGARIHHSFGLWPLLINDTTKVESSDAPSRLVLTARGWPAGEARVTVRHTAAAPAVDVRAGGTVVAPGLTNPNEASLEVPAGTISADVTLAGTDTVAIGPADLTLAEGTVTAVYARGSADAGYQLAVQTFSGMSSSPSGVPGGTAGLVDDGLPLPLVALTGAGLVAAALAGRKLLADRV